MVRNNLDYKFAHFNTKNRSARLVLEDIFTEACKVARSYEENAKDQMYWHNEYTVRGMISQAFTRLEWTHAMEYTDKDQKNKNRRPDLWFIPEAFPDLEGIAVEVKYHQPGRIFFGEANENDEGRIQAKWIEGFEQVRGYKDYNGKLVIIIAAPYQSFGKKKLIKKVGKKKAIETILEDCRSKFQGPTSRGGWMKNAIANSSTRLRAPHFCGSYLISWDSMREQIEDANWDCEKPGFIMLAQWAEIPK